MDFWRKLEASIRKRGSLLCVGLDPVRELVPAKYADIAKFGKAVIDATRDAACCYKPNIAFFEALGGEGLHALSEILAYIPNDIPVILDGHRIRGGDGVMLAGVGALTSTEGAAVGNMLSGRTHPWHTVLKSSMNTSGQPAASTRFIVKERTLLTQHQLGNRLKFIGIIGQVFIRLCAQTPTATDSQGNESQVDVGNADTCIKKLVSSTCSVAVALVMPLAEYIEVVAPAQKAPGLCIQG